MDQAKETIDELVESTQGLRPWRKVFHAGTGLSVVFALMMLDLPRSHAMGILGAVAALLLVADGVRLAHNGANELFFRSFRSLVSPREAAGVASSTWYAFGMLATIALVPRPEALSAILVLGLADPLASVVGQKYGRHPFLGGSVEGTATFLVVAFVILGMRHDWPAALAAGLLAALAERRSWPLDDNFSVPVVTGLTLFGVATLL